MIGWLSLDGAIYRAPTVLTSHKNFAIEISNTQEDRCNALDVDANIKLDICNGMICTIV